LPLYRRQALQSDKGEWAVPLDDLHYLPLLDVSDRIRRREVSPVAVLGAIVDRIARLDAAARSYTTLLADRACATAVGAEKEIAAGLWRGPLHGIPLAVEDLCATSFAPTTGGMPMRKNSTPDNDATVVRRLEDAGAAACCTEVVCGAAGWADVRSLPLT